MAEDKTSEVKQKLGFDFKIIVLGLIFFLIAMGAAYFMIKSLMDPLLPKEETVETKEVLTGNLVEIGEFTTNISDIAGNRFIKVEIFIEVTSKKNKDKTTEFMPVIQDSILTILSSKNVVDLDVRNREHIKEEIKNDLNDKLGTDMIKSVYFTSFVMH